MQFYYGYISGTYLFENKYVNMLPTFDKDLIMEHTYVGDTDTSQLKKFGLDKGLSSVIADKVDVDLTVVANPIRAVMELLLMHKFEDAKFMIDNMFLSNAGIQTLAVACCDFLMRFDEGAVIYDFLCENISMFRTTLMQRTAFQLRQAEREERNVKRILSKGR